MIIKGLHPYLSVVPELEGQVPMYYRKPNGVPLKQIQEWLGHSDFSTTANIYAHLDYRSKISSAQAMEQGMLLPRSDDFGSRWEDVTEQGKIAEPDLNPVFD